MGLREKVALATMAMLAAQIIHIHCMPRDLPNGSIKRHISSLTSPKGDRIREFKTNKKLKKNYYNNIIVGNSSKVLNLPNVEGYHRFFCEYPPDRPYTYSNSLPHTRNFKREAKQKRYLDIGLKDKAKLPITSSALARDAPPQPYCFRKSDFFPEVEYPLSARDMWIPKYWSRLLDAEVPYNVKNDAPIYQNLHKNTKSIYSSYENSQLYDIIQTLNTHNKTDKDKINSKSFEEFFLIKSEDESINDIKPPNNIHNTTSTISSSDIHSEVLSYTPTTAEVYPVLETIKASSAASSVTSPIIMPSVNRNDSSLTYTTTPMMPNIATTTSIVTTDIENFDFDVIDFTTTSPFEDSTSPMTRSLDKKEMPKTLFTNAVTPQVQELQTSVSETNTESTAGSQIPSFISSVENRPEQEPKDHTIPMPYTKMESGSDFDIIDHTTISPVDIFTFPMIHSEALPDNSITHTQTEKIPGKLLTTVTSTKDQEGELLLSETNTEPTNISSLPSFTYTAENKSEQEIRDYTTPMQPTPTSKIIMDDEVATDPISFSSDGPHLLPSLDLIPVNTLGVNNKSISVPSNTQQENITDLDTNETLLKHDDIKNSVHIKPPRLPSHSIDAPSDHSFQPKDIPLPANHILPPNEIELDNSQHKLMEGYFNNLSNDSFLQLCSNESGNSSIILMKDCKENWVFSPNDSYVTWDTVPEYPDECFILVDTENTSSKDLHAPTKPEPSLTMNSKQSEGVAKFETSIPNSSGLTVATEITKSQSSKQIDNIPQSKASDHTDNTQIRALDNIEIYADSAAMADNGMSSLSSFPNQTKYRKLLNDSCFLVYDISRTITCDDVDEKEAKINYLMQEGSIDENTYSADNDTDSDLILYVETINSTLENVNLDGDETWASYTEIPFDSLNLYPEDANDTWSTNGKSYVIYQETLPEVSDETTLLFLDTEKTSGLLNDIILNIN